MTGEHLLHDFKPAAPKRARQGEPLWTLAKDGVTVTAELLDQSTAGVELRMLRNGEWQSGRRFRERASAIAHAENHRRQLLSKGWQAV
jgi:hypothetical protein